MSTTMRAGLSVILAGSASVAILASGRQASAATFVEQVGVVSMEAEHFTTRNVGESGNQWQLVPAETSGQDSFLNPTGGEYIQALPNIGVWNVTSERDTEAYVDYSMDIATPGTYQLYLRWDGRSGDNAGDSIYASIVELADGAGGSVADWYRLSKGIDPWNSAADANFATDPWQTSTNVLTEGLSAAGGTDAATWAIGSAGTYTLRLVMREDGAAVDKLVFQLASTAAPTGDGPTETTVSSSVPEPGTAMLGMGLGLMGLLRRRRIA